MKGNLNKILSVLKRFKRMILLLLIVILAVLVLFFIVSYQKQKKQELRRLYYWQNAAFYISGEYMYAGDDVDCFIYQPWEECRAQSTLYIWTKFYYQETGNMLTLEEIEEYLSSEYEDDGELRIKKDHKKIREYVEFMYESDLNGKRSHFEVMLDRAFDIIDEQYPSKEINYATLPLEVIDEMIAYTQDNTYEMQIEEYLGQPEVTGEAVEQ